MDAQPKAPLAKGGWFGEAKPGGFRRQTGFHIGLCFRKVLAVESLSHASGVPAPFSKGAFLRPVSFYGAIPGFFRLSIDSVGRRQSQNPQTQTGAEVETPHPSQSEGSIPVGSTRGILKGGTIRAGASCSPLKPASLLTFLPEQESKAPLASARSVSGINFPR